MCSFKVIVLVAVVAFVQASPQYHPQASSPLNHIANVFLTHATPIVEDDSPANYNFGYTVNDPNTQDVKQQQETRVGQNVQGHYSIVEPDGTRRVVHYTADQQNGFNAVVQHEGVAVHPAPAVNSPVQVAVSTVPNHVSLTAHQSVPVVTYHNSGAVSHSNFNLLHGR